LISLSAVDALLAGTEMKTQAKVVVVGSINTDMVVRAPKLPAPGETVLGGKLFIMAGGKGANQAVAAARLGAITSFVARVGTDSFGDKAMQGLLAEGINISHVCRDPETPSGVALIGVDETRGENSILVAPGANARLSLENITAAADLILSADVLVCQLEVPLDSVTEALRIARTGGVITILNPAPARALTSETLELVSILTPNETEAEEISGLTGASAEQCGKALLQRVGRAVIVTLGANGAMVVTKTGVSQIAGRPVDRVVDTTAAGDCFTAALAVALGEGESLATAAEFANAAAALSVSRAGAQPSLPRRGEMLLDGF
jgi:ribokinase